MIYEKEEKYLENEQKLKDEDQYLTNLEQEVMQLEIKLKEKNQENNLLDFKLRNFVRNKEHSYLKPYSGIHHGILSQSANQTLG